MAEQNENTIVDVKVRNRFEVLVDINDSEEPRLKCTSSDQNISTPELPGSSYPLAGQSTTSTGSAVTSVAVNPS